MPAAGWAAKSGDPVLWTGRDELPAGDEGRDRSRTRSPTSTCSGPRTSSPTASCGELRKLGSVKRISGPDPVTNAIAFARFTDGVVRLGRHRPGPRARVRVGAADAGRGRRARRCRASGTYGPLLLLPDAGELPQSLQDYLLDIQPGYDKDPVRGVYNHGWLMGDESAISADVQARIDTLLEIQPVDSGGD